MSDMVETVARALLDSVHGGMTWERLLPGAKAKYRRHARTAMAAMREPNEAMRDAGVTARSEEPGIVYAYRAMITAALQPVQGAS